jgi:hypothetical protein
MTHIKIGNTLLPLCSMKPDCLAQVSGNVVILTTGNGPEIRIECENEAEASRGLSQIQAVMMVRSEWNRLETKGAKKIKA